MKAKGLRLGRAGHRKGRLTGKQVMKAKLKWSKNTHHAGAGRCVCGNTLRSPVDCWGGQRVAWDLLYQTAWGSSEWALRNVFSPGSDDR